MKIKQLILAGILLFTSVFQPSSISKVSATTLEAQGDTFTLLEESYDKTESFVFTSTINFNEGQAAGLVFGAKDNEYYWVFNMDRYENRVKLMYFDYHQNEENQRVLKANVLKEDYFIGNDKLTEQENNLIFPKVREVSSVILKVIISVDNDDIYAEFFADGIKRFGVDSTILLNSSFEGYEYNGGNLGYNGFNSKINITDEAIGKSDYTYYSELYRQQYHFSQFSHWNNDPNGLVYYQGYYHLYYQHHPYNKYWGDMHWGHARSKDLVHWENLPICLFPESESDFGLGNGFAWSGSARVYHKGESEAVDSKNWFPNGNGDGLIAFYTRDGGWQDQVLITSDDNGMTWEKRVRIPQSLVGISDRRVSCRDPKVFEVTREGDKVTMWGMTLANMEDNHVWFLKSTNLLDWSFAGEFKVHRPECIDVLTLTSDDEKTYNVMTFSSREYIVGKFNYNPVSERIEFIDLNNTNISTYSMTPTQKMDYGPDSYASQTFFIDDKTSEYYGKAIGLSWFSGVPNISASAESGKFAAVRSIWNGGGMTIPVEFNLVKNGEGYLLSQTPITKNNDKYNKKEVVDVENVEVNTTSENILKDVNTKTFELEMEVSNPNRKAFSLKINVGEDEYTEIGWNEIDGYYVDRTHTSSAGILFDNFGFDNYHLKYTSGATDGTTQKIYLLSDNGGIEVFCDDFKIPFYVLTLSAPTSCKAEFTVSDTVVINSLKLSHISSIWKDETKIAPNEGVILVDKESITLDTSLTQVDSLTAYSTLPNEIEYSVLEGEDVIELTTTSTGVDVKALTSGEAKIKVKCGELIKVVEVNVLTGSKEFDVKVDSKGIVSGKWYQSSEGLIGSQSAGDGFILFEKEYKDVIYSTNADMGNGAAIALVFRAKKDMSDYLIANYDNNAKVAKLWSPRGEIANVGVNDVDPTNVNLEVVAKGDKVQVKINGNLVIDKTLSESEPKEGYIGLNICATQALFKSISLGVEDYVYTGGDLVIKLASEQYVSAIYNENLQNSLIPTGYYSINGRELTISKEYFKTLKQTGDYVFKIQGSNSSNSINVDITQLPEIDFSDIIVESNLGCQIFIGYLTIESLTINHKLVDSSLYSVKDNMLLIDASILKEGTNRVYINNRYQFNIEVLEEEMDETIIIKPVEGYVSPLVYIIPSSIGGYLLIGLVIFIISLKKKKVKENDN